MCDFSIINFLLNHDFEEKTERRREVTRRRKLRHTQLLANLKASTGYWKLTEETPDCSPRRTRFGQSYGHVGRKTRNEGTKEGTRKERMKKRMNEWMNEWKWHITYRPRCQWNTEEKISVNLKEVYWTVPSGESDEQKPLAISFKNLIEEKKTLNIKKQQRKLMECVSGWLKTKERALS
jgi:hypothetical protein